MGTIQKRKRSDGTLGYTAQVRLKRDGRIVHSESKTFDRRQAANAWIVKREDELAKPGALETAKRPKATLAEVIDKYVKESVKEIGRTKAQVLRSIKEYALASKECGEITSTDIVDFANQLSEGRQPQTVGNYLSHLSSVFAIAKPAWGFPLNADAMDDAQAVLKRLGNTSASKKRDRRPTLGELDKLLTHFTEREGREPDAAPMHRIIGFALFSTRRQEEIHRITWADLDIAHSRVLVRDMKHPGQKKGNDMWCELPKEALKIAQAMPKVAKEIFPYVSKSISSSFTRACHFLEIEDLRFHDLRHEGVSRLFEMGRTLPQAASVSGHRSWSSLQRYAHIRQVGDRYKKWKWLAPLAEPMEARELRPSKLRGRPRKNAQKKDPATGRYQ